MTLSVDQATCLANTQLDPTDLTAAAADVYAMPTSVMLPVLNCEIDIFNLPSS